MWHVHIGSEYGKIMLAHSYHIIAILLAWLDVEKYANKFVGQTHYLNLGLSIKVKLIWGIIFSLPNQFIDPINPSPQRKIGLQNPSACGQAYGPATPSRQIFSYLH